MQARGIHETNYFNRLEEQKFQINERGARCGSLIYEVTHLR